MDDLDQQIDLHCSRLVESYKILLKRGQVLDDSVQRHEQLQVYLSCDNIISHAEALLDIIQELRLREIIQSESFHALDNEKKIQIWKILQKR